MELINEYIYLQLNQDTDFFDSYSIFQQDDSYFYFTYLLSDRDCFFDLSKLSNKIYIKISKKYFNKYKQPFFIVPPFRKQIICHITQSKLYELITCKLVGIERYMLIESIVLFLLFKFQNNCSSPSDNCDTCSFNITSIFFDKIELAKSFIINNLEKKITIPVIATFVGTNQCYLKKGFKELTNQTIFDFIQEKRMLKAKYLLQSTNISIKEISSKVGYSSLSSFSQTYKNYFGISPSLELKLNFPISN